MGGIALSWKSRKQSTKAMSTTKLEYMAACSVSEECCYLKSILQEMKFPNRVEVYIDSRVALSMILNLALRQKA